MELRESQSDLSGEELGLVLIESLDLHEMLEKLTTLDELHDEVNAELILEDVFHANEEWMVI